MKRLLILLLCCTTVYFYSQNTPSSSSTVSSIQALIQDQDNLTAVTLTWTLPANSRIKAIRVYRSNAQIFSSNIPSLTPIKILSASDTLFEDTVPDIERDYYYAVICELDDSSVFDLVIPSVNATVTAVTPLPIQTKLATLIKPNPADKEYNERSLIPLPYLNIILDSEDLKNIISLDSQSLVAKFGIAAEYNTSKPLYIFPEDTIPLSGEQYLLSTIINNSFIQNDWIKAEKELENFLSINRSLEITKRATFYTAQALYFQARYPEALRLFIDTEDTFPDLTRQWIESALILYEIP